MARSMEKYCRNAREKRFGQSGRFPMKCFDGEDVTSLAQQSRGAELDAKASGSSNGQKDAVPWHR